VLQEFWNNQVSFSVDDVSDFEENGTDGKYREASFAYWLSPSDASRAPIHWIVELYICSNSPSLFLYADSVLILKAAANETIEDFGFHRVRLLTPLPFQFNIQSWN